MPVSLNPVTPRIVDVFYESPPVISPPFLQVTPKANLVSSGIEGGPFTPLSIVYRLKNTGGEALHWTAGTVPTWVAISELSGDLNPGEFTDVGITLDGNALNAFLQDELVPHTALIEFLNTTNHAGDTTRQVLVDVSAFVNTMLFRQYDGPFVYPACAFEFNGRYYKTQSGTGENRLKYAPVAGSVHVRACSIDPQPMGSPPASYGLLTTELSGSVTRAPLDCSTTGAITVHQFSEGIRGAYDHPVDLTGSGNSIDAAFTAALGSSFGGFLSGSYQEEADLAAQTASRIWSSPEAPVGFFPGSIGGQFDSTYCQGYTAKIIYSNPVTPADLLIPVAREGVVGSLAQTQSIEDLDSGTRTENGKISQAIIHVAVDPGHEQLTGDFTFLVTPLVGDPYTIQWILDFPISGAFVDATVTFPHIVGASVKLTSWSYSYQKSVFDSFDNLTIDDSLIELPASPSWQKPARMGAPVTNTDCWDSFEEFPLQVGNLTSLITGQRWAAGARLSTQSRLDCYDDFENYAVGTSGSIDQGIGWKAAGHTHTVDYLLAYDDFESYSVGAITDLNFTSTDNEWADSGRIG